MYIDDFTGGAKTSTDRYKLYRLIERVLKDGGFPVHKFLTNDPELRRMVSDDQVVKETKKVLGLPWNTTTDKIIIDLSDAINDSPVAKKRVVASSIMKIFDPLGFASPIVIAAKCILQETWQSKSDWDVPIPENLQRRWREWQDSLKNCPRFELSRCYVTEHVSNYSLFGFCDASTK